MALYDGGGGVNQSWTATSAKQLTVFDTKCLDAEGGRTGDGANQKWSRS